MTRAVHEPFARTRGSRWLTALFVLVSAAYVFPLVVLLMNSFKYKDAITNQVFMFPTRETFAGLTNYIRGITSIDFFRSIGYSAVVTILSVALILICTSMSAWFITRIDNKFCKTVYYLFVFSMAVPFQMVMFTLPYISDKLGLTAPWTIPLVYLGFGAGLSVFMFAGFVKSIPLSVEEAAMIDGCNPLQTFFRVVLPIMKPTYISVAILETMWIWNDYLLPTLVLDKTKGYYTIPMAIQSAMTDSYGTVDYGAFMALLTLAVIPIIIFYALCQKHIIKGVISGAVKG
ncbi:MAG: carbohydrate ABC transporter permease [Clostridiales bacterium]|nr:MAG: carbohydrate ABC transporter permease [Clostridiales bacterium]